MSSLYESMNDSFQHLPVKLYRHDLVGQHIWAPLHWHRSIEILIAFEGRLTFHMSSENFDFTEDDWIIVNSSELHSSRYINPDDHFKGISILISSSFIDTWLGPKRCFYNPHITELTQQVKTIAENLYHSNETEPYYDLYLMSQICTLLHLIGKHCIRENVPYESPLAKEPAKAAEILDYIEHNYQEQLNLNTVASHFKYSPGYFSRYFKNLIGVNYHAYLNFVRVNHAAEQLLKGHSTLTECALNNGFPNTKSFITMFKKQYGCTPGKFLQSQ